MAFTQLVGVEICNLNALGADFKLFGCTDEDSGLVYEWHKHFDTMPKCNRMDNICMCSVL